VASQTFFDINAMLVELEQLQMQERHVSRLRRRLHERIDTFPNDAMKAQERAISEKRRALHRQIDALRAQLELNDR